LAFVRALGGGACATRHNQTGGSRLFVHCIDSEAEPRCGAVRRLSPLPVLPVGHRSPTNRGASRSLSTSGSGALVSNPRPRSTVSSRLQGSPPPFPADGAPTGVMLREVHAMPGSVRAARVTAFVLLGLCFAGSALAGFLDGPRLAGAVVGASILNLVIGVMAFSYARAGNGVRVSSITLASIQLFFALGMLARAGGSGILPMVGDIVLTVLLCQGSAKSWFKRRRVG